ncbi:MAG TPA: ScyD/ScyE family protein [Dongiaceae bacterium]|nr:ScyD/ScyE family protein [Dongiaceae bacterium]
MRRALILFALLFPGVALADPTPATGWKVEELPLGLKQPSGLAWSNGLIVTDLATGRVVRVEKDGALADLTKPLQVGIDVMGQPTGPYKVKVYRRSISVSQGWPDTNAEPVPTDHAIISFTNPEEAPHIVSSDFWNPYDFEIVGHPDDSAELFVVDAGKNALLRVEGSAAKTVYEFPRLKRDASEMSELSPTEFAQGAEPYEVDAVPTGLAISDGRVWVALFGGFPFVPKGGAVVSLALEGEGATPRMEVNGLDSPIDVEFTDDGDLLILEMGAFDMATGFVAGTGRLSIVDPGTGKPRPLLRGLDRPVTVLAAPNDEIYISALSGHIYRLKRAQ